MILDFLILAKGEVGIECFVTVVSTSRRRGDVDDHFATTQRPGQHDIVGVAQRRILEVVWEILRHPGRDLIAACGIRSDRPITGWIDRVLLRLGLVGLDNSRLALARTFDDRDNLVLEVDRVVVLRMLLERDDQFVGVTWVDVGIGVDKLTVEGQDRRNAEPVGPGRLESIFQEWIVK